MKQQFRNLLAQATELANEVFDYNGSDYADIVQEKFAELIVKECMSYMEDGDIDFAKFMIKKNFGLTE